MKKVFSLKNFIVLLGAVLAITACFLLFCNQIQAINVKASSTTIISFSYKDIFFGNEELNGNTLPFIGYILVGVGGAIALGSIIISPLGKLVKLLRLIAFGLCITGSVFVFMVLPLFISGNTGYVSLMQLGSYEFKMSTFPLLSGIFGCVGGAFFLIVEYFTK